MGKGDALPIVLLLLLIIVPQAYAGYATEVARETADEVFVEPSATAILPSQAARARPEQPRSRPARRRPVSPSRVALADARSRRS